MRFFSGKFLKPKKSQQERNRRIMDKEDFLLRQIDEFREKAKRLQNQLNTKESDLEALEQNVGKKEGKVRELESVLESRKQEADVIVKTAGRQIQDMASKVENKLGELILDVEETLGKNETITKEQTEAIVDQMQAMSQQLEQMKTDLSDKTHSENVKCYRNVQSVLDDVKEQIAQKSMDVETKKELKGPALWSLWFGILNFILLAGYILYDTGILNALFQ